MAGFSSFPNSSYSSPFFATSSAFSSSTSAFGSSTPSNPVFGTTPPPSTSLFGSAFAPPSASPPFSAAPPTFGSVASPSATSPTNIFGGSGSRCCSSGFNTFEGFFGISSGFGAFSAPAPTTAPPASSSHFRSNLFASSSSGKSDLKSSSTSSMASPSSTSSVSATAPTQSSASSAAINSSGTAPPAKANATVSSSGTTPFILSTGSSSNSSTSLSFSNVKCVIERMTMLLPEVPPQDDGGEDQAGTAAISLPPEFMSRFAAMESKVDAIYQWHLSQGHFPDTSTPN